MTLASAVEVTEATTLSYSAPAANPVQDAHGNRAESFSDRFVAHGTGDTTAPTVTGMKVNGDTLTVTFNEDLYPGLPGEWDVDVAGTVSRVASGATSGDTLTLTLTPPVVRGQIVELLYVEDDDHRRPRPERQPDGRLGGRPPPREQHHAAPGRPDAAQGYRRDGEPRTGRR